MAIHRFNPNASSILRLHQPFGEFSPLDIPNLATWVDFSDPNTMYTDLFTTKVSSDGQRIRAITDKSGNGRHFEMWDADRRFAYKTNIQNGLSVGRNDQDGGYMWLYANKDILRDVSGATLVGVCIPTDDNTLSTFRCVINVNRNSGYGFPRLFMSLHNGQYRAVGARLDTNSLVFVNSGDYPDLDKPHIFTVTVDYANRDLYMYRNGSFSFSNLSFSTAGNTNDTDPLFTAIMSYTDNTNEVLYGDACEFLIYHQFIDPTSSDFTNLHNYLKDKWDI